MAEGILKDLLPMRALAAARVGSAGTGALAGYPASVHAITVCAENGIDIEGHRSRPLSPHLIEENDLILTMEDHHRAATVGLAPDCESRIHLLARYAADNSPAASEGVGDPIGGSLEEYRATYRQILGQIEAALPRIEREILAAVES